jgi:hypothetical protein
MANAKDAVQNSARKFLLLGDTGGGKTTQFLTLPGRKFAYLFDPNAILSLQGHDLEYEEFLPDRLNLSVKSLAKGRGDSTTNFQNDLYVSWEKDFNDRIKGGYFDNIDAILFDSATTFLDLIMDRVLTINGRAGSWPQQDDYGPQMLAFQNVCRQATALGKTVVMTGHVEMKQDELTKRIYRSPMLTGRLKTKVPLLFSDIYLCEATNDGKGVTKHTIQTVPDRTMTTIRCTMKGLNPVEDVTIDWNKPIESQGIGGLMKRRV